MSLSRPLTHQLIALFAAFVVMAPPAVWALGSTPVTVVNPSDIAKAQGIQHPTQFVITCTFNGLSTCADSFTVGTNARLIIEFVSVNCTGMPATNRMATLLVSVDNGGGIFNDWTLNLVDHAPIAGVLTSSQPMRVYANPGAIVRGFAQTDSNSGVFTFCFFNISGQQTDVP
ncbi:MAG TPA: hypothetical protein VFJ24_08925 [Gaiellales bacterium]|nr:hypothetical protein [Gaiellales bacterium]